MTGFIQSAWRLLPRPVLGIGVAIACLFAGCSSEAGAASDTSVATLAETGEGDTAVAETSASETGASETVAGDTGVTDTSVLETVVNETSDLETVVNDTGATDTEFIETSVTDAETSDEVTDTASSAVEIVGTPNLIESGWSAGRCAGLCVATLTYAGAELSLEITSHDGTLQHAAVGMLTTDAAGQLEQILEALAGQSLETRYGCPGCADGPVAYLTLTFEGGAVTSTYGKGDAPAVLAALDALVAKATAALETCTGDATVVINGTCPLDF